MQTAAPAPVALPVTVDTTGAKILEGSPAERDSRDIYLPNHVESVSHIAIDIGGSLAKVVYFTRIARSNASPTPTSNAAFDVQGTRARSPASPDPLSHPPSASASRMHSRESSGNVALQESVAASPSRPSIASNPHHSHVSQTADGTAAVPAGTLTPTSLFASSTPVSASAIHSHFMKRRSLPAQLPGGRLNFVKFETADIESCVRFLVELISLSAKANNVSLEQMRQGVKIMATGGGAHLFYDMFERELGVEVRREDEMGCLITGLNFITLIPDETFYYSDELVDNINATFPDAYTRRRDESQASQESSHHQILPRPSPDPPLYSPVFDSNPLPKLPCLLVNIGSGVSIIKVDEDGKYERVSGTSLGGGTLWGLLSLLTDAESFDEMLEMASRGDNGTVDMLVSDVYGASDALNNLGLKSTTIASSFGKVFRKDQDADDSTSRGQARQKRQERFKQEDICKSLLYAISNNIGQIAYMNAEKFGLDRIYFGGCFIRGHQATIATLSYAIRFWSKGAKRAFFLRHEGYLGALGAWIRQFYDANGTPATPKSPVHPKSTSFKSCNPGKSLGETLKSTEAVPTPIQEEERVFEPPAHAHREVANGFTGSRESVNPILADALGGASVDTTSHRKAILPNDGIINYDDNQSQGQTFSQLSEGLSEEDRQILEPILQSNLTAEGEGGNIAELLQKMDAMHGATDGLESRLDSLLARLDGILDEEVVDDTSH